MRKIECKICGKRHKPSTWVGHLQGYICPTCGNEYCRSCAKANKKKCPIDKTKLAKIRG